MTLHDLWKTILSMSASDVAAWWGDIVATFVALSEWHKYRRSGVHLSCTAWNGQMLLMPGEGVSKGWISVDVRNVGGVGVTIEDVSLMTYRRRLLAFRKLGPGMVLNGHARCMLHVPAKVLPGDRWTCTIPQTASLLDMIGESCCVLYLSHSANRAPVEIKVKGGFGAEHRTPSPHPARSCTRRRRDPTTANNIAVDTFVQKPSSSEGRSGQGRLDRHPHFAIGRGPPSARLRR